MSQTDFVLEFEFQMTALLEIGQMQHPIVVTFYKEHFNIDSVQILDKNDTRAPTGFRYQISYRYQEVNSFEYSLIESFQSVRLYMNEQIVILRVSDSEFRPFHKFLRLRAPQNDFGSHYQPLDQIRQGAQGSVVRCHCSIDNETYAVKFLNSTLPLTKSEIEIHQLLAKYPHKNIQTMKEYFIQGKYTMIVFPYINGGTLFQYMTDKRVNKKQIDFKKTFKQILQGLEHIHNIGLIHRDIKMDNIMVEYGPFEIVKIIDFGFAIQKDNQNLKQEKCGTLGYMAPEIMNEQEYNEKCDIFSLSQVFHTMLTGCPMYDKKQDTNQIAYITKYNLFQIDKQRIKEKKIIDLLEHMINKKENRFSAQECLNHQFLKKNPIALNVDGLISVQFKSPFNSEN